VNDKIIVAVSTYLSKYYSNESSVHSSKLYQYLMRRFIRFTYNHADLIVTISEMSANDLNTNFGVDRKKLRVSYNPYEVDNIKAAASEPLGEYEALFSQNVIITLGRMYYVKAHWHLIRAFSNVHKRNPNASLAILGSGELEPYLKQLTHDLGLEQCVHFIGFQSNPFKFLKHSKCLILSSLNEGFPNVIAESMACGTPIISTDCRSGPREMLAPDTDPRFETKQIEKAKYGMLIPVCDGTQYDETTPLTKEELLMAHSMCEMLDNHELRAQYATRAQERIADFDVEKIMALWEGYIKSVLS
ncbi:MAG: glycosyltransferase, partial [Hyphomonadaceae bacterium]|nr:glycosyltransferase [Clostridia bacterium]